MERWGLQKLTAREAITNGRRGNGEVVQAVEWGLPVSSRIGGRKATGLAPQVAGELLRHGLAMLRPFAGQEGWPVGGVGEAFAVGGAEAEEHREATFTEGGMLFEREALLQLHLRFR